MRSLPLIVLLFAVSVVQQAPPAEARGTFHPALDDHVFPAPVSLRPAIAFWKDVFARYGDNEIVIHDDLHLDVIYSVVDVSDLVLSGMSDVARARERARRVNDAMDDTRTALRHLGGDRRLRVADDVLEKTGIATRRFSNDSGWYRSAPNRVRSQSGLRDQFARAIQISGMFIPEIERILAAEGLPKEISRLPFVESMYNYKARSKVGASGAWQFTRSTGRLYLRIDSAVDERSDVLLAAGGAAKYLRANYSRVNSWPLALTGYNHGIGGMVTAANRLGTKDIGVIVERYNSRSFGFASRNFYAEFLAAVIVYSERSTLFPGVEPLLPLRSETFTPDRYISLLDLAGLSGVDEQKLVEINPALNPEVARGELLIPEKFPLRVPEGSLTKVLNAYQLIPEGRRRDRQLAQRHTVKRGETMAEIARRYGTSVSSVQRANSLPRADRIYIGQVLEIPTSGGSSGWTIRLPAAQIADLLDPPVVRPAQSMKSAAEGSGTYHVVRPGESLSVIADRYGVPVETLARWNQLSSPDRLSVGQKLQVGPGVDGRQGTATANTVTGSRSHVVRSGDTLAQIANDNGTTVDAIMRLNSLRSTVIRIGQVLAIP